MLALFLGEGYPFRSARAIPPLEGLRRREPWFATIAGAPNFPLAIIEDPNYFDGHSTEELYREVIHGMNRTFELIETGELFEIKTSSVIAQLEARPHFARQLENFRLLIEEEKAHRAQNEEIPIAAGKTQPL